MSVGDLPASSQTRARRADGVGASQAAGHGRLKGQRLHGAGGVRAVVIVQGGQERLRGVAPRWGWLLDDVARPFTYNGLLVLPGRLGPSRFLRAALFVFVPLDRGLRAAHERRVGDVRPRASRGLWGRPSAAGGAGLWGGRHRAVWAVALETGSQDRDQNEQWRPGQTVFHWLHMTWWFKLVRITHSSISVDVMRASAIISSSLMISVWASAKIETLITSYQFSWKMVLPIPTPQMECFGFNSKMCLKMFRSLKVNLVSLKWVEFAGRLVWGHALIPFVMSQRVGLQLLFQIQFVSALSTETFWEVGQTKQTETDIIVRKHRYTTRPCPSFRKTMLSCSCVTTHMAASPLLPPLFTCMLPTAFPLFITPQP